MSDAMAIAPLVAVITIAVAGFFGIVALIDGRRTRLLRALAAQLGGCYNAREYHIDGAQAGTPFQCAYVPGGKSRPPAFHISVACVTPYTLVMAREGAVDRWAKRVGLAQEVTTGDPAFDRVCYVQSDAPEFARAYCDAADKRLAVQRLFQAGAAKVALDGETVRAIWSPVQSLRTVAAASVVTEALTSLRALTLDLPTAMIRPTGAVVALERFRRRAILTMTPFALILVGMGLWAAGDAWFQPLDHGRLFLESLKYSLAAMGLFWWLALRLLAGSSSAHRDLARVVLVSLIAFPFSGFGLGMTLNGCLDGAPAARHHVPVVSTYRTGRHNRTHYVVVRSWRSGRPMEHLRVPLAVYQRVRQETRLTVTTKPGALGCEWIQSYRID